MTYQEVTGWLFGQLASYQQQGSTAYKPDLSNITAICNHIGQVHKKFKTIHIAGTNGKGSTSHMLASVLQEAGYKTGLYTSPHLKDFRERIRINGECISEAEVIRFTENNKEKFKELDLSFFEMTVAMAFHHFAEEEVDIAIIEVGLGGRLDATNIIRPELSLITNISLDHTGMLGNTIEEIAGEKGGIIKKETPVLIGQKQSISDKVFQELAKRQSAPIYWASDFQNELSYETDLKGEYQKFNKQHVIAAVVLLRDAGWSIDGDALRKGLENVVFNTSLLGRWQQIGTNPDIICDTGHNEAGIKEIASQLKKSNKELHIVFGMLSDKNAKDIVQLLPQQASYYLCEPTTKRAMPVEELKKYFEKNKFNYKSFESVAAAVNSAKSVCKKDGLIFVGGSTFVVAEII